MKVKIPSFLILLTICILIISGCTSVSTELKSEEVQQQAQGGVLDFRITWQEYSGRGQAIEKIVNRYNETEPVFSIRMVSGDEDREAIETLLLNEPKTIQVLPYRYVKYFGEKGLLVDLSEPFQESSGLFYPAIWDLGCVQGNVYGVPWLGHSMCLLYNKTILNEAGVSIESIHDPESFADALSMVELNTDAYGIGLVGAEGNDLSWMVNQFVYGFGASLVSEDGKTVALNDQSAEKAIAYYRDVLGNYAQPTWTEDTGAEVMNAFRENQVAFEIQGIWGATDIDKNGAPFEVGIVPMHTIGMCAEVGPMMLSLSTEMSEQERKGAYDFLNYLISIEAQEMIMDGEYSEEKEAYYPFRTPIRIDMAKSDIFLAYPEYASFIEGFRNPSVDVPVPDWQIVKERIYEPGLHRVMLGELSIDAFLQSVESEGNQILSEE